MGVVIALAGRRVDAAGVSTARFPLANVEAVHERLRAFFTKRMATSLVSSAACGADLVALTVAQSLGLRRRVVLPFEPQRFRTTSVTDRPGEWGELFDRTIQEVSRTGDLVVLEQTGDPDDAYAATNEAILDEATNLASGKLHGRTTPGAQRVTGAVLAVVAWDGHPREGNDLTIRFVQSARERGLSVAEVSTL